MVPVKRDGHMLQPAGQPLLGRKLVLKHSGWIAPSNSASPAGEASNVSDTDSSSGSDSKNSGPLDGPTSSGGVSYTHFVLWWTPPTMHLSLDALHGPQTWAQLGGGHSHILSTFAQLSQLGLGPGKLCAHFFPC